MKSHPVSKAIYVLFALLFVYMPAMAAAPENPHHPFPADGASGVQRVVDMSWLSGDADGDSLTYSVYFGTSEDPPLVKSGWTGQYFDPYEVLGGPLAENTTYTWRIVVNDGLSWISSDYWSFTTTQEVTIDGYDEHVMTSSFERASSVIAADMDGDGDMDFIGSGYENGLISWWENNGTTDVTTWTEHPVDDASNGYINASRVFPADIDNDNDMDLVAVYYSGGYVIWWENTGSGTTWVDHVVDDLFDNARDVSAADIDGDGDLDVLGAAYGVNDITWWENDGTSVVANWTEHTVDGAFSGAFAVHAADLDGDGDLDIIGGASEADLVVWWENDGTNVVANWTEHEINASPGYIYDVHATDMDNDGDLDVLGASAASGEITWWENDGSGAGWFEYTLITGYTGAQRVHSADIDGDGDMDVLAAAQHSSIDTIQGDFSWWENDGTNVVANWTKHLVDGFVNDANHLAYSVFAADMNGDGVMDILGADFEAGQLLWWELLPGQLPTEFTLVSPADGDTVWGLDTTLVWHRLSNTSSMDSVFYEVWMDTLPDLSTAELAAGSIIDTLVNVFDLWDDQTYFWTVVAADTSGLTTWASDTFSFSTYYPEPPDSFALVAPENGSEVPRTDEFPIVFYWEESFDPDPGDSLAYVLELSTDELFGSPLEFWADAPDSVVVDTLVRDVYYWRVVAIDGFGLETYSSDTWILDVSLPAAESVSALPEQYSIDRLYPNPFNPTLSVVIGLPETADLRVTVHNVLGQRVAQLINDTRSRGYHTFVFNGTEFASGLYFVRAVVPGKFHSVRKVMLVK